MVARTAVVGIAASPIHYAAAEFRAGVISARAPIAAGAVVAGGEAVRDRVAIGSRAAGTARDTGPAAEFLPGAAGRRRRWRRRRRAALGRAVTDEWTGRSMPPRRQDGRLLGESAPGLPEHRCEEKPAAASSEGLTAASLKGSRFRTVEASIQGRSPRSGSDCASEERWYRFLRSTASDISYPM